MLADGLTKGSVNRDALQRASRSGQWTPKHEWRSTGHKTASVRPRGEEEQQASERRERASPSAAKLE
eukprot:8462010-Karenia_brevis.AAC.1